MENGENKLEKAIEALKNEPIAAGPPQEVVDNVLKELEYVGKSSNNEEKSTISYTKWLKSSKNLAKVAAAAVLLIFAGYAVGRISSPLDTEQLRSLETSLKSSLEPAIRQDVVNELSNQLQYALVNSHEQLKEELNEQFRDDMSEFGLQILAASSNVTNRLLTDLIDAINTAQTQDRQWVAAAFQQTELNRLQDKAQLINGIETLASQTEDELQRTRQEMAQFLTYTQPSSTEVDK